ncbi:MAG: S-adenosylmethionine:tRNA ribosyltransferase-isomerase, partial [Flavobacteriaceae bacterium]|nr:S-adenosylmethionine:tRNA ribosyltransferase-isomerase [Flavobacteriaceae bacterium]
MKLSHFGYTLPEELLAEYPSEHRDEARLMVLNRKDETIEHKLFKDLDSYFDEGDVMIFNNTKV